MKRTREQVVWDFVREWLRKAEGDLRAAEHLLALEQEDYFVTAFHAQQAAEKFLKAFLVRYQIPFPKTHDIGSGSTGRSFPAGRAGIRCYAYAIWCGRYPGETVADRETARSALQEAHRVKAAVQRRLQAYLAQGRPSGRESA